MHFKLFSFFMFTVTTTAVVARPPPDRALTLNPPKESLRDVEFAVLPSSSVEPATNAKRFSQGLPPMSPRKRKPHRGGPHRDPAYPKSGTRVAFAPRSKASPSLPIRKRCNILVKEVDVNGTVFGFVSAAWNILGEYGPVQPSQNGSLEISFSYSVDSLAHINLLAVNGPSAKYPFIGGTLGFVSTNNDLSPGSYNYFYITGTTQTPHGSPPVEGDNNSFGDATGIPKAAESAIWTYDPVTNHLSPQWVNTDGSTPANYLIYANDFNNAFVVTGDPVVFRETFGTPYPGVTFTCVPPKDT